MDAASNFVAMATPLPQTTPMDLSAVGKHELGNDQIENVARDFESIFISLLLKEMRSTLDPEQGGLFGSEGTDTFGGMFDLFMGQHLAESQSFGIADAVKSYFKNMDAGL